MLKRGADHDLAFSPDGLNGSDNRIMAGETKNKAKIIEQQNVRTVDEDEVPGNLESQGQHLPSHAASEPASGPDVSDIIPAPSAPSRSRGTRKSSGRSSGMSLNEEALNLTKLEEELLSLLAGKELYGLQICDAFEKASGGLRKVGVGTLYPTLNRMEKRGLIISRMEEHPRDGRGGARRKYFKITRHGIKALAVADQFRENLVTWQPVM
jgi:DNA-binding PadR family transcriptional regulator